jgi:hypothetical protein
MVEASMILVVDDERDLGFEAEYARNSSDALAKLVSMESVGIAELWLDHDLGFDDSGMLVVDWLCERAFLGNPYPVGRIFIHSANGYAARAMLSQLERWYKVERRIVRVKK